MGGVLETLINAGVKPYVMYVTKGNFYKGVFEARQRERDRALAVFGDISYKQLNYDDSYKAENHKYNDSLLRSEIKADMKAYILELMADMIICVDFDSHADHCMTSALFDEIIRELIAETAYRPIILKKFAYLGVWSGRLDYFSKIACETKAVFSKNEDTEYAACLPNQWDDRICFEVVPNDYDLRFWKSKLFKAYCKYWSQCGFRFFFRASNADAVYWYRNVHNLMMECDVINVSSGEKKYINDFSIANMEKITSSKGVDRFSESAWIPDSDDAEKTVTVKWNRGVTIRRIKLYQNFEEYGHIDSLKLTFSNGYAMIVDCASDCVQYIDVPRQSQITYMTLIIVSSRGEKPGIRELEVYEEDGLFPWLEVPLKPFDETKLFVRKHIKVYEGIAKAYWFVFRAINKVRKWFGIISWP